MNHLHAIDYLIIIVVLGITLWLGLRFASRQRTTEHYFLSKGHFPSWALGLSLLSTLISSVTFLGYPEQGYTGNWILLVQGLMVPVVLVFSIWFIVPLFRRVIGLSTYEYFERRFGKFARYYSSSSFIIRQFAGMGTVLFLISVAISTMTGLNPFMILTVVGGLLVVVNLYGGMQAVVWLDVFQGFMLFASGFICLFVLIGSIEGGWNAAIQTASEFGRTGFGPYDLRFDQLTVWVMIINGAFYAIQKYGTDQTVVQRYLSADSDRSAIRASMLGISLTVPIWATFMFIGTLLFVFYRTHPLPEGAVAASVFPHFIMTQLPVGVAGFIVAALISAAICSLSADLNSLAAVGLEDYYRSWKKDRPDREYLLAGKMFVGISGLLAVGVGALYLMAGNEGVLGIIFTVYAIFSGGIVGIFLLGMFVPRANRRGVNIAIISCILFTAWAFLTSTPLGSEDPKLLLDLGEYNFGHHKLMLGVYSHLVLIGVGYVASLCFPRESVDDRLLFRRGR